MRFERCVCSVTRTLHCNVWVRGNLRLQMSRQMKMQPCWPCKLTADAQTHRHLQEADSVRSLGPQVRCLALQRAACVEAASSLQGIADLQELSCLR